MSDLTLYGPYGATQRETAEHVREAGGNAMWFHGFNPEGFAAAESAGISACVEFKTFRADFQRRPELVPIGRDGNPIRFGERIQGVCLSNRDFVAEREAELAEGMARFTPTGVWLDYLTYAGWFETPAPDLQESCFCPSCIREFCRAESVDAESPDVILTRYADRWWGHKCRRIDSHGRRFADIIRDADQECAVGVYMCPWTPEEYDGALSRIFAQDYRLFSEWVDAFTPLVYAEKSGRDPSWSREYMVSAQRFVPPEVPVLPILDYLDFPASVESLATSPVPPIGLQLFAGAKAFDNRPERDTMRELITRLRAGS